MAVSNLQTSITNIRTRLYNIESKLNELVAGVSTDEYADFEIPNNYTLLEYIQANGSCWCNSGYIPKSDTTIYGKLYMASQSSSYPTIFGARNGSPYTLSWYSHNMTDNLVWVRNNVSNTRTGQTIFQNTLLYLDSTENYKTMKFLNEFKEEVGSITWSSLPTDSRMQHPLYFFTLNNNGSVDGACYCSDYRIHYIKFYENGNLVRGYCACLDGNGTPCFYDIVSHTTFYNQGSGSFVAGPEHVRPAPTLPYRELEYIESTGTQYIDTNFKPNQDTTCEVSLYKNTNNSCRIFGAWSTSYHENTFSIGTDGTDNSYIGYDSQYDGSNNGKKIPTIPNGNHIVGLYKNVYKLDGNIIKTYNYQNFNCTKSIYLFVQHTHNEALEQYGAYRLYYCKIWDNNTLVRNMIPVKRKSDNVICMYDLVSKQFYTNSGTGTFIAGPEV